MTEEIKEILEDFKKFANEGGEHNLMEYEIKHIQCYITNLQQENEKLKYNARGQVNDYFKDKYKENKRKIDNLRKENKRLKEKINTLKSNFEVEIEDCENYKKWYRDYKSRCEKAIEYINFVINHYKEQLETPIEDTYFDSDVNRKGYILSIIAYLQTALDTLIGSDENE